MDWLDERFEHIKQKVKNMSLKRALIFYIAVAIFTVSILYIVTIVICQSWKRVIEQPFYEEFNQINGFKQFSLSVNNTVEIQSSLFEYKLLQILQLIEKFSVFLYSIIAIIITSNIFYKNKLEEPMNLLKEEARYISRDDLSFACRYESGDEMGEICEAFDKMRVKLIQNQENMWDIMEEQRKLNAAFAHDLRTPLTVMQGYTELLMKYYPQNKISEEKLMTTIELLGAQVNRLKRFSDTMKDIHTFEQMEVKKKKSSFYLVKEKVEELTNSLQELCSVNIIVSNQLPRQEGYFDLNLILEVFDNIISNAIRYTVNKIDITLSFEVDMLYIYVRDDGRGFSKEELYKVSKPYYSDKESSEEHFGIGLNISKILCQKHGGNISFANSTLGGAIVCVSFFVL